MTFKHVKFEDSAVMRSLEKLAKEKGLVDSRKAPTVKTASAPDLGFPQASTLMENVLKLCAGLRHAGFDKHAQDIEEKFLAFKSAQTLYETSTEKGDDLVDAAHPKGSHKLEDVDGDEAVFETILDQHLKSLKMIDKMPTGKLAGTNLLDAVKVALATDEENEKLASQLFLSAVTDVSNLTSRVMRNEDLSDLTYHSPMNFGNFREDEEAGTGVATGTTKGHMEVLLSNLNELAKKGPSQESMRELQKNINTLTSLLRDADNINPVTRAKYTSEAREIYSRTPKILLALRGELPAAAPKPAPGTPEAGTSPFQLALNQIDSLKEKIEGWLMYSVIRKSPVASAWIKEEVDALVQLKAVYSKATPAQQTSALGELQKEIASESKDINEFESKWIKG